MLSSFRTLSDFLVKSSVDISENLYQINLKWQAIATADSNISSKSNQVRFCRSLYHFSFFSISLSEPNTILYDVFMGVPSISSMLGSNSTNFMRYPGSLVTSLPKREIVVSLEFVFKLFSSWYSWILFALRYRHYRLTSWSMLSKC